jgi:outer membrane lipoprotein-sorting protein
MKKSILLLVAVLAFVAVHAQTAEEIVKKYTVANKLDKLSGISTVKITGKMSMMGMDVPVEIWMKSPDKLKTVVNLNGQMMVTAIDGTKGYTINPMAGSTEPTEIPVSQVQQSKNSLVFNNYIEDYLKKGKLTLEGSENVGDKPAYKLKIDMEGGTSMRVFIDKGSYLMVKSTINTSQNGMDVNADIIYSDFKDNNGVFLPMKQTTSTSGMDIAIVYNKVEVNIPMEDSIFKLK